MQQGNREKRMYQQGLSWFYSSCNQNIAWLSFLSMSQKFVGSRAKSILRLLEGNFTHTAMCPFSTMLAPSSIYFLPHPTSSTLFIILATFNQVATGVVFSQSNNSKC